MNVKPFRIWAKWYIVVEWYMYGPFDSRARAQEVYAGGVERAAARKKKKP